MKNLRFDISIVGGGIVGIATAYKLQLSFPSLNIIVLEKEKELSFHQTGRNSGVIHSGLYYTPGSFRAKNCVDGRKQLVDFAKKYSVKHDICGKIVLATTKEEEEKLSDLKKRGEKNGLIGLEIIGRDRIKAISFNSVGTSLGKVIETENFTKALIVSLTMNRWDGEESVELFLIIP